MSAGQRSNILQLRLDKLLTSIHAEILKMLPQSTTPRPHEAAFIDLGKKIDKWTAELQSMSKEMRSMQKRLEFEGARVRQLRRDYRYSHQQSVRDRQKHVKSSQDMLNVVTLALARLCDRLTPTDVDFVNGIHELLETHLEKAKGLKELEKLLEKAQAREATTCIIEARSQISPAQQVQPGAVDGIAIMIMMLQLVRIFALSFTKGRK